MKAFSYLVEIVTQNHLAFDSNVYVFFFFCILKALLAAADVQACDISPGVSG